MKALRILIAGFATLLVLMAWLLPIGPVPGLFIGGTDASVPDIWGDTSAIHEIKLKVTNEGLPRVVTIWVVQVNEELYVVGAKDSGWVTTLGKGGSVLMKLEDKTYPLNASIVTGDWQTIVRAYKDKYRPAYPDIVSGFPSIEEAAGAMVVFKLAKASQGSD